MSLLLAAALGSVVPVDAAIKAPAPLADVNGDAITNEDLERALGARLRELEEQIFELKRRQLDAEVTAKVPLVTEQEAPPIVRVEVPVDGAPTRGVSDASVTLVEFSDFHCPFCKRVQSTLPQLLEVSGQGKVGLP